MLDEALRLHFQLVPPVYVILVQTGRGVTRSLLLHVSQCN
jgi:hypothetical protein